MVGFVAVNGQIAKPCCLSVICRLFAQQAMMLGIQAFHFAGDVNKCRTLNANVGRQEGSGSG